MASFLIYDTGSGAIISTWRCGNVDAEVIALLQSGNVKTGQAAMDVPDLSPSLSQPAAWKVQSGSLTPA